MSALVTRMHVSKAASLLSRLRGNIQTFHLPALSPTMKSGVIKRFHKFNSGDQLLKYDLFLDVECESLFRAELDRNIQLEIEVQDDLYLATILSDIGVQIPVGTLVALFCEEKEDVDIALELANEKFSFKKTGSIILPVTWQAYMKNKEDSVQCGL